MHGDSLRGETQFSMWEDRFAYEQWRQNIHNVEYVRIKECGCLRVTCTCVRTYVCVRVIQSASLHRWSGVCNRGHPIEINCIYKCYGKKLKNIFHANSGHAWTWIFCSCSTWCSLEAIVPNPASDPKHKKGVPGPLLKTCLYPHRSLPCFMCPNVTPVGHVSRASPQPPL